MEYCPGCYNVECAGAPPQSPRLAGLKKKKTVTLAALTPTRISTPRSIILSNSTEPCKKKLPSWNYRKGLQSSRDKKESCEHKIISERKIC